jgi:hypothetical protein
MLRHTLWLTVVLAACGGSSPSETLESSSSSAGGEAVDPELPLETYLSPTSDYVAIDLERIRLHPQASVWLDRALEELDRSTDTEDGELAEAVRRTRQALVVSSVEEAIAVAESVAAWIFIRGDYRGFAPSGLDRSHSFRRGDHTMILSKNGEREVAVGDPGERLDAAIVARVNIGETTRANLAELPTRATVETAQRLRLRVALGEVISVTATVEHLDDASAQRSIDELSRLIARAKPMLLLAPRPVRRIADKLILRREDNAVVAQIDLTMDEIRDLGELVDGMDLAMDTLIGAGGAGGGSD